MNCDIDPKLNQPFDDFRQLEKAAEQERLLEESAKEMQERRTREEELKKRIEEKEVHWMTFLL